jgi:hypothetical protein
MTMAMTMTTMTLDDVGNSSSRRQRELATLKLPDDDDDDDDDDEKNTTTTTTILMMSNATDDEEKEDAYDAFEYQPVSLNSNCTPINLVVVVAVAAHPSAGCLSRRPSLPFSSIHLSLSLSHPPHTFFLSLVFCPPTSTSITIPSQKKKNPKILL